MNRRTWFLIALLFSASAFAAEDAVQSGGEPLPVASEAPARKKSFEARISGVGASPDDVNYVISEENAAAISVGSSDFEIDEIKRAFEVGGLVTVPMAQTSDIALGISYLGRFTEDSGTLSGQSITESFMAAALLFEGYYRFKLVQTERSQFYVAPGAGFGAFMYHTEAEGAAVDAQSGGSTKLSAGAAGLTAGIEVGGKYLFNPQFGLSLFGGYRYAKSGQLKVSEETRSGVSENARLVRTDGKPMKVDLSGAKFGVGIFYEF